jgi:uncharacterized protein YndB with AHSA1/START domain
MPDQHRRTDSASLVVAAPPERVYGAFADPDALMAWLPPDTMTGKVLAYDFREGGQYCIELTHDDSAASDAGKSHGRTDTSRGRFRALEPPRRIVQTVEFDASDPAFAGEMVMTWSFEPVPEGTRVQIVAEHVPPGIAKADHDAGLRSSLENLARYVQSR